ncbi:MAG TPA: Ig-like domain-containing domain [Chitinophagaceae bacterium]|nr:Ig-like domain-containing domain [Chitinophagaceae bacterium]
MGKFILFVFPIIFVIAIFGAGGCANIIPPSGGPRDTLPPVLVAALPKDSALNFNAKKITLTFNEYVQLDNNMNNNLIVSPYPVNIPTVENKLKTVTVYLRDSLKPNTTYSINFGRGVKDVNEGNVAKNLTYVFSTGNHIDNGTLSGNVTLAENGKKDSALIVLLHNNLSDTSIRKNNPVYLTRLDSAGNFRFRYIAPGRYNVFVLPDEYSKKYDDSTKMFAFLNSPVDISSNAQSVTMYAYREFEPKEKKPAASTGQTGSKKKNAPKEEPRLLMSTSINEGPQDLLQPFVFKFPVKIGTFDSSKIVLCDTNFIRLKGYTFSADTSFTNFSLHYNWAENEQYKIIVQKDAFKDTAGTMLEKNDTLTFKTRRESEYGSIRLHFNNLDLSKNPVLLLVQGEKIVTSVPLTTNEWYQRLYRPGDYEIRILNDDNKNGVWDPGNYDKKLQPEIIIAIPRKLTIKANLDSEVDVNL